MKNERESQTDPFLSRPGMRDVNGNWVPRFNDDGSVNLYGIDPANADSDAFGVAPRMYSSINGGPLRIGDGEVVVLPDGTSYGTQILEFGPNNRNGEVSVLQGLNMGVMPVPVGRDGPYPSYNGITTPDIPVTVFYYPGGG